MLASGQWRSRRTETSLLQGLIAERLRFGTPIQGSKNGPLPLTTVTVWGLAFNGKGTLLASGGADSLVKLWDTTSWTSSQTFRDHKEWVRSVVFEPAGTWLASASGDGDVRTWRTTKP